MFTLLELIIYDIQCLVSVSLWFCFMQFVDEFLANFVRYKKNRPMNYVVDWAKGY